MHIEHCPFCGVAPTIGANGGLGLGFADNGGALPRSVSHPEAGGTPCPLAGMEVPFEVWQKRVEVLAPAARPFFGLPDDAIDFHIENPPGARYMAFFGDMLNMEQIAAISFDEQNLTGTVVFRDGHTLERTWRDRVSLDLAREATQHKLRKNLIDVRIKPRYEAALRAHEAPSA